MIEESIALKLKNLINKELSDAAFYKAMSKMSANINTMQIMLELSGDESEHADMLMNLYKSITGSRFIPDTIKEYGFVPDFHTNIRNRIDLECNDYKRYSHEYINSKNRYLKEVIYKIQADEFIHIIKLSNLIK